MPQALVQAQSQGMQPATVLVLNAGSSSLKAAVLRCSGDTSSSCERLWHGQHAWDAASAPQLDSWLGEVLANWQGSLSLVGHRVVHGGTRFSAPVLIDPAVRQAIAAVGSLAPLHNAVALQVIDWMEAWLRRWQPALRQWACFDTAFHSSLPPSACTYALPADWRALGLRRFGFHGLNHQHVAETVAMVLREQGHGDAQLGQLRLISAHLGAGASLCAIAGQRSVATTMGFTPLEGLVMATRSGSVDPGLLLHLLQHEGLTVEQLAIDLNQRSGLLGLSGLSGDMRILRREAAAGHSGAQLAIEVFTARLLEGIGAMAAALGGVDVLALSGGIGENDEALAHELHNALSWLGPLRLLQIPANEEGQIASQCLRADQGSRGAARLRARR